ncbi:MAG: ATP-binding protein [Gemmatimonadota bacterium]
MATMHGDPPAVGGEPGPESATARTTRRALEAAAERSAHRPTYGAGEPAAAPDDTLELKVDNMSFLLERLGDDCAPDQLVRELTVNAIQAIQDTGGPGAVVWDHDPTYSERFGAWKLSIVDTGIGMTGPEMVRYINHLAASAREQTTEGNFGVGAKIAAATRNPAGMVYLSWKGGEGALVWLWRNPETGRYGLRRLPRPDGTYGYWTPAPDESKPEAIGEHGTVVVLLGEREDADTMLPPGTVAGRGDRDGRPPRGPGANLGDVEPAGAGAAETDASGRDGPGGDDLASGSGPEGGLAPASSSDPSTGLWLVRYLNGRFFEFPEDVEVRAREFWGSPDSRLQPVRGARRFLEAVAEASGRVDLGDAVARWWILPEGGVPERLAARHPSGGHVGALYQDELYELYTGRAGAAKLQSFGVAVGHHRVVLYVEPRTDGPRRVASNTARTALLVDGRPLPWADWAEAFRRELPEPIIELMEEAAAARDARDHTRSFKERMKGLANLLMIGSADPEEALRRLFAPDRGPRVRSRGGEEPAATADEAGADAAALPTVEDDRDPDPLHDSGPADDASTDLEPHEPAPAPVDLDLDRLLDLEVAWVAEAECGAPGRAGHYIAETNTLLMNRDFRVFVEYIDRWRAKYEDNPAAQREVEDLVREWLEQPLRELVIRSHFLRGADDWSDDDVARLLSDEALTAVSLPCYLTEMRLRRAVAQRLGKLRDDSRRRRRAA